MSTVYYYFVGGVSGIAGRVTTLDSKILIDPDLQTGTYTSTVYNAGTTTVEVTFSSPLNEFKINVLNNLTVIILFDGVIQNNVYNVNVNGFNRRCLGVTSTPTSSFDLNSGFSIGSTLSTTTGEIYTCTDNTASAAVWAKVYPIALNSITLTPPLSDNQSLVYNGSTWRNRELCCPMGELWALGDGTSTATLTLTNQNEWYVISVGPPTLFSNNSEFSSDRWDQPSSGVLRYLGQHLQFVHTAISLSSAVNISGNEYQISLFKNDTMVDGSFSTYNFAANNRYESFAFHKAVSLTTNDNISIRMRNITSAGKIITFQTTNLVAMCCCPE